MFLGCFAVFDTGFLESLQDAMKSEDYEERNVLFSVRKLHISLKLLT